MTSDVQRSAMEMLAELWALSPDVRLGQLMAHLGFLGETYAGRGLSDIDDDELMAVMQRHREELMARQKGLSEQLPPPGPGISLAGSSTVPAAVPR
jgi:hypothetical protein